MSGKTFNVRLVNKHDVEANWLKAVNFVPKQGEIIVYDVDENYTYERFKIGDGTTLVSDLPFAAVKTWDDLPDLDPLVTLSSVGMVDPIFDSDGSVFVDETGSIYSL